MIFVKKWDSNLENLTPGQKEIVWAGTLVGVLVLD